MPGCHCVHRRLTCGGIALTLLRLAPAFGKLQLQREVMSDATLLA